MFTSKGAGFEYGGFELTLWKAAQQFLKRLEEDWGDEMGGSVGQEMVGCTPFLMGPLWEIPNISLVETWGFYGWNMGEKIPKNPIREQKPNSMSIYTRTVAGVHPYVRPLKSVVLFHPGNLGRKMIRVDQVFFCVICWWKKSCTGW